MRVDIHFNIYLLNLCAGSWGGDISGPRGGRMLLRHGREVNISCHGGAEKKAVVGAGSPELNAAVWRWGKRLGKAGRR